MLICALELERNRNDTERQTNAEAPITLKCKFVYVSIDVGARIVLAGALYCMQNDKPSTITQKTTSAVHHQEHAQSYSSGWIYTQTIYDNTDNQQLDKIWHLFNNQTDQIFQKHLSTKIYYQSSQAAKDLLKIFIHTTGTEYSINCNLTEKQYRLALELLTINTYVESHYVQIRKHHAELSEALGMYYDLAILYCLAQIMIKSGDIKNIYNDVVFPSIEINATSAQSNT